MLTRFRGAGQTFPAEAGTYLATPAAWQAEFAPAEWSGIEPSTSGLRVHLSNHYTDVPVSVVVIFVAFFTLKT